MIPDFSVKANRYLLFLLQTSFTLSPSFKQLYINKILWKIQSSRIFHTSRAHKILPHWADGPAGSNPVIP